SSPPSQPNLNRRSPHNRNRNSCRDYTTPRDMTRNCWTHCGRAGPDRGCWTWWGKSQSPQTCGAVARHQLQEIAVYTYDAQLTVGAPQPLPDEVALDGAEEFLSTICTTTVAWPHEPSAVDYHATEGRSWRNWLSDDGARLDRLPEPGTGPPPPRSRTRPTPPPEARPMSWSSASTAVFLSTP
ncbi:hypothetical protein ACFYX0_36915, partial [Streptomyces sp. NPDC002573]